MGDRLRFSTEGPRELDEADFRPDGKAKVVVNPEAARVQAAAKFEPIVDPKRQDRLLEKLDARAGTQRGKPRSQDPTRNPLGGRLFDVGCGWPMYRQPYQGTFRYLCGLYQQSHGAKCMRQRLFAPGLRSRLEQKLRALAESERARARPDSALAAAKSALAAVRSKRERAGQNLALADGPDQYRAVADVFEQLKRQEKAMEADVRRLERLTGEDRNLDAEVEAALAVLDRMADLAAAPQDLTGVGRLFRELNARMFLRFTEVLQNKRTINKVAGGVVTFGASPPPVALYEGPTGRRHVKGPAASEEAVGRGILELPGHPGCVPGGEGESLGNVSRGERI
jgi:hypothetical protein